MSASDWVPVFPSEARSGLVEVELFGGARDGDRRTVSDIGMAFVIAQLADTPAIFQEPGKSPLVGDGSATGWAQ